MMFLCCIMSWLKSKGLSLICIYIYIKYECIVQISSPAVISFFPRPVRACPVIGWFPVSWEDCVCFPRCPGQQIHAFTKKCPPRNSKSTTIGQTSPRRTDRNCLDFCMDSGSRIPSDRPPDMTGRSRRSVFTGRTQATLVVSKTVRETVPRVRQ